MDGCEDSMFKGFGTQGAFHGDCFLVDNFYKPRRCVVQKKIVEKGMKMESKNPSLLCH